MFVYNSGTESYEVAATVTGYQLASANLVHLRFHPEVGKVFVGFRPTAAEQKCGGMQIYQEHMGAPLVPLLPPPCDDGMVEGDLECETPERAMAATDAGRQRDEVVRTSGPRMDGLIRDSKGQTRSLRPSDGMMR